MTEPGLASLRAMGEFRPSPLFCTQAPSTNLSTWAPTIGPYVRKIFSVQWFQEGLFLFCTPQRGAGFQPELLINVKS